MDDYRQNLEIEFGAIYYEVMSIKKIKNPWENQLLGEEGKITMMVYLYS